MPQSNFIPSTRGPAFVPLPDGFGDPAATSPAKDQFIKRRSSPDSIVDYLNARGQPSDQASRVKLGSSLGISGIVGPNNAEGNTALLNALRGGQTPDATTPPPTAGNLPADSFQPIGSNPVEKSPADIAFESYLNSLKPSSATTEAQGFVNDLNTKSALARERALNSGDTLGFAAGEAQRVGRNFDIKLAGAAGVVQAQAALDANRQNISKARFDFEQGKIDAAESARRFGIQEDRLSEFTLSPGQTRFDGSSEIAGLPPTPKAPGTEEKEKPLSTVDIKRIEELYDFTPPLGATMSEVVQFVNANPNASPAELQAGADAAFSSAPQKDTPIVSAEDFFKGFTQDQLKKASDKAGTSSIFKHKSFDVKNLMTKLNTIENLGQKIQAAQQIKSDQEILDYLLTLI